MHCGTKLNASTRREFLWRFGGGLGGIALVHLLGQQHLLSAATSISGSAVPGALTGKLHHPPKAKRVIQLFMNGGASQMDLFDHKPELMKRHGEKFDPGAGARVEAATSEPGKILKPMFEFKQHGQCGRWVSSLLPHTAQCVIHRGDPHAGGFHCLLTGNIAVAMPAKTRGGADSSCAGSCR